MKYGMELGAYLAVALLAHAVFRSRRRLAAVVACAAVVLGVGAVTLSCLPDEVLWGMEIMSQEWIGLALGAIGGLALGAASAAVRTVPSDVTRGVAIGVFAFTGLTIALSYRASEIFLPFEPSAENRWNGDVCRQTTATTCGAASLATCLRVLGVSATEHDLAIEANTSQEGACFSDLAKVARRRGVKAIFLHGEPISKIPLPAIAGTTISEVPHAVAIVEKDGRRVIADPLGGGYQPLNSPRYKWSGVFVSLSRR
jgi:hypothetical protein